MTSEETLDSNHDRRLNGATASSISAEEADTLRTFSRTPRPYHHDELEQWHDRTCSRMDPADSANDFTGTGQGSGRAEWQRQSGQVSVVGTSSESGSEADDERPHFVKALPPSTLRPRKGLKTGEKDQDALLTPSQLDEREKELTSYFSDAAADKRATSIVESERAEKEKLLKRRFAEFVRRTSEVALMAVILLTVLCGEGVARTAWQWRRELLSQFLVIILLILVYPVKLSIVDQAATPTSIWQRFRVPASFDPATVLYPPLLPVMVALSVAPPNSAVVLPNIILGLASLPQRLFPRSSRLGGLNAVHWLIAIVPLVLSEHTAWPKKLHPPQPYIVKASLGLSPETLVTLYPLHHALLQPLQHLTTTSLLVSELHLLSAVLINLLLLADSPQTIILKACLWIGGVILFVSCGPVLHWNVVLARIPRWKLRRPGHTAEERKSLVDAVSDLIHLQRTAAAFHPSQGHESDADEDQPSNFIKSRVNGLARLNTADTVRPRFNTYMLDPGSPAHPQVSGDDGFTSRIKSLPRRRNTMPVHEPPETQSRTNSTKRSKSRSANLLWCLQLTPEQAHQRKWLYAGFIYLVIITTVAIPVRSYVSKHALHGQEPVGWAVGYLLGQIPLLRSTVLDLGLDSWIPLPRASSVFWTNISLSFPVHIDLISADIGAANTRLLLVAYWVAVLLLGLLTVFSLTAFVEVDTRRKVFHGVMVAMFLPATFVDPCFCSLAVSLVLAIFLLLEVIRAGQVPPLGNAIGRFVAPYVDGRDLRGPVVVSHIFLLIGCAVPLWFSLASFDRAGDLPWRDWDLKDNMRETAMIAGVVCVGMGDAAASLIGRRYGRRKWIWVGGKSIEGSAAFAVAVTIGLLIARAWQDFGGWKHSSSDRLMMANWTRVFLHSMGWLLRAVFCACGASFMEAVLTGANDNVVVPVALWLLIKGCRL